MPGLEEPEVSPGPRLFGGLARESAPGWRGLLAIGIFLGVLALAAACLFYTEYLRWDFNELGYHYDEASKYNYSERAGWIYSGCFVVFVIPAAALVAVALRRKRKGPGR